VCGKTACKVNQGGAGHKSLSLQFVAFEKVPAVINTYQLPVITQQHSATPIAEDAIFLDDGCLVIWFPLYAIQKKKIWNR
jgi:hypothetical protein